MIESWSLRGGVGIVSYDTYRILTSVKGKRTARQCERLKNWLRDPGEFHLQSYVVDRQLESRSCCHGNGCLFDDSKSHGRVLSLVCDSKSRRITLTLCDITIEVVLYENTGIIQ